MGAFLDLPNVCTHIIILQYFFLFHQAVCELGLVLYAALDFGLGEQEERTLSEDIEGLLDAMTEGNNGKRGFFPT